MHELTPRSVSPIPTANPANGYIDRRPITDVLRAANSGLIEQVAMP